MREKKINKNEKKVNKNEKKINPINIILKILILLCLIILIVLIFWQNKLICVLSDVSDENLDYFFNSNYLLNLKSKSNKNYDLNLLNNNFTWLILYKQPGYWYHWFYYKNYFLVNQINYQWGVFQKDWCNIILKYFMGLKADNVWPFFYIQSGKELNVNVWRFMVGKLIIRADSIDMKVKLLESLYPQGMLNQQFFLDLKRTVELIPEYYKALLVCDNIDFMKQYKMYLLYCDMYVCDFLINKLFIYEQFNKKIESEWFYYVKLYYI